MPAFFHFNTLAAPITWEVGDDVPELPRQRGAAVVSIRANGKELEHIRYHFDGIRNAPHAQSMVWVGEDAQFIFANLPNLPNVV